MSRPLAQRLGFSWSRVGSIQCHFRSSAQGAGDRDHCEAPSPAQCRLSAYSGGLYLSVLVIASKLEVLLVLAGVQ